MMHYQTEKKTDRLWIKDEGVKPEFELKTESVFAQCNGYLGVRAVQPFKVAEEKRGMFLSGAFSKAYENEVTELVNCPDVTEFALEVNGEKVSPGRTRILECTRKLDLNSGELAVRYVFELKTGTKIAVENRRFASLEDYHIFAQRLKVRVLEGDAEAIRVKSGIDGQQTNSGVSHFHSVTARVYEKEMMEIRGELSDNTVTTASCCRVLQGTLKKKEFSLARRSIYGVYTASFDENGIVVVDKVTYVDQGESGIDGRIRRQRLVDAGQKGYTALFEAHCIQMAEVLGRMRIRAEGMTLEEEAAVAFATYHIIGMTPWHTDASSIAAKGLTGEGYKGHVFWDTEIFLFPYLLFTCPEEAKRLLTFRYKGLDGARKKAKDYGFKGAMFPWEAAKTGEEETPLYAALNIHTGKAEKVWSGIKEYHVTADIIYALEQYFEVTKDQEFMDQCGYEMAFEAAKFWVSRAVWDSEREAYLICDVIGPDEYTEHVDNNTYTNYMASYCVRLASGYADALAEQNPARYQELDRRLGIGEELKKWKHFTDHLYLAVPGEDDIIPQDDTFLQKPCLPYIEKYKTSQIKQAVLKDYSREEVVNMQVLKQADVVMLLNLFPHLFSKEIVRKNVLFYESRTIHDSSLSYCAHAQACAVIGAMDLSWRFFQKCLMIDIDDNPHDSTDGVHSASLGGIWNCMVFGFTGFHYENGILYLEPHLPEHWKKMEFCLVVEGTAIRFSITDNVIQLESEEPMDQKIRVNADGQEFEFKNDLEIHRDWEAEAV